MNPVTICRAKCFDVVIFYRQVVSVITQMKKTQNSRTENETKQNWYEFPCANSLTKCLEDFEKMTGF